MSLFAKGKKLLKRSWDSFIYSLPKKTVRGIKFRKQHGYKMNFNAPETLDEKLNWLLVNHIGSRDAAYVDKIAVREYVTAKGLGEMLPKIYGIWEHASEIPLEELPDQFVLKCNHASGRRYYEMVYDKAAVDWPTVLERLERMLHINYAKAHCEYQYEDITPRIYAEEMLEDGSGHRVTDYKVYCFHGKPYCIMTCIDRGQALKRLFFDLDWNCLDYEKEAPLGDCEAQKPTGLSDMLKAAEILAKPFPFARIDLYDVAGKVYFGEITLTPDNCNIHHLSEKGQRIMGGLLDLERVKRGEYR